MTALWAAIVVFGVLWPGRLAGPLDGIPLDTVSEALAIGAVLCAILFFHPRILRHRGFRALALILLVWKAATSVVAAQDGWCVRFTSPVPLFINQERVPHSWDVRADWRSEVPRCSAVMTAGYDVLERFPAWFYNLPPANFREAARDTDRPPHVTLQLDLEGYLDATREGVLAIPVGEDVEIAATIDDRTLSEAELRSGVSIQPGSHRVAVTGTLVKSHWSLEPTWNGRALWRAATATMSPAFGVDRWLRPWGRYVPMLLVVGLVSIGAASILRTAGRVVALLSLAQTAVAAGMMATIDGAARRAAPVVLLASAIVGIERRNRNIFGAYMLLAVPFLTMYVVLWLPQAGIFTWYSSGDDWWMFQRFAYRIYMEGYWLEAGERTFWFQPFYRWIAGGLHMIFGDSSIGEAFWDAACATAGALLAFHAARTLAGFRWGIVAGAMSLAIMTIGPAWYLFGRGLSEISSSGFISAAALCALRARHGDWRYATAAGLLATLAFFTRLNNLPMVLSVAAFALPLSQPAGDIFKFKLLWRRASRPVLAGVLTAIAIGLWLFTARTYYYTKVPSMLYGTQAGLLSVWQQSDEGLTPIQNVIGSFAMVLTMTDPPAFDVRAIPIMVGVAASAAALAGVPVVRHLPLNLAVMCVAGIVGAFVARGSAYPGRFSIHLIPVSVALTVCLLASVLKRRGVHGRNHGVSETQSNAFKIQLRR